MVQSSALRHAFEVCHRLDPYFELSQGLEMVDACEHHIAPVFADLRGHCMPAILLKTLIHMKSPCSGPAWEELDGMGPCATGIVCSGTDLPMETISTAPLKAQPRIKLLHPATIEEVYVQRTGWCFSAKR